MLHYDGIDLSIAQLPNGCFDMTQTSMSFNDVAINAAGRNDYRTHFLFMTKSETVDRIKNAELIEKSGQALL